MNGWNYKNLYPLKKGISSGSSPPPIVYKNLAYTFPLWTAPTSGNGTVIDDVTVTLDAIGGANSTREFRSNLIPVTDKAYSMQINLTANTLDSNVRLKFRVYDSNENLLGDLAYTLKSAGSTGLMTIENRNPVTTYPTASFVAIVFHNDSSTVGQATIQYAQFEEGETATTFEAPQF